MREVVSRVCVCEVVQRHACQSRSAGSTTKAKGRERRRAGPCASCRRCQLLVPVPSTGSKSVEVIVSLGLSMTAFCDAASRRDNCSGSRMCPLKNSRLPSTLHSPTCRSGFVGCVSNHNISSFECSSGDTCSDTLSSGSVVTAPFFCCSDRPSGSVDYHTRQRSRQWSSHVLLPNRPPPRN